LANALKAHDMTTTKMRALAILSISSPVTINQLSLYALTEQSTISRTLDSLEEQGFIVRCPRAEDPRVRDVDVTPRGREAFAKFWPTMYDALLKMFEGIDNEEYKGVHGDASQSDSEHSQAQHLAGVRRRVAPQPGAARPSTLAAYAGAPTRTL
jgi:MarR family transcriptional regulator, transcriptional regulator for hemolysin